MLENFKKTIQNIQTAEDSKKKRWLFILSALAMILVIGVWTIYLNKIIVNLGPAETEKKTSQQQSIQIPEESSWQIFIAGLKTISSQIKELIAQTREISIEANNPNFIPGGLNGSSSSQSLP